MPFLDGGRSVCGSARWHTGLVEQPRDEARREGGGVVEAPLRTSELEFFFRVGAMEHKVNLVLPLRPSR
jgi:hypothetical protein